MTPDKQPFFAATYLPKHARLGQPGLLELVPRIHSLWDTRRHQLVQTAERLTTALQDESGSSNALPGRDSLHEGFRQLRERYDAEHGGFGKTPKFPLPHRLFFLLRYWRRTARREALSMVETILQAMHDGGMYDHVGGGFHRYATDAEWPVPHYEKVLYDQALLSLAYLEAYQATARQRYAHVTRETLDYVLRDMQHPHGGFYAAEDADSPDGEGAFYRWNRPDIESILGEEAMLFFRAYDVSDEGRLHRIATRKYLAAQQAISESNVRRHLHQARRKLFGARNERPPAGQGRQNHG